MNFSKIIVTIVLVALTSCDKGVNIEGVESLAGHWHVWDFEPNVQSENATLAKESILKLVEIGCDPIDFTFMTDTKVSYRNGMRYLNPSFDETGVKVTCAPVYDEKQGTFNYDFETLTLNFNSGTVEFNAVIEDEFLTTLVDDLVINGATLSGKLYFIRETGY